MRGDYIEVTGLVRNKSNITVDLSNGVTIRPNDSVIVELSSEVLSYHSKGLLAITYNSTNESDGGEVQEELQEVQRRRRRNKSENSIELNDTDGSVNSIIEDIQSDQSSNLEEGE